MNRLVFPKTFAEFMSPEGQQALAQIEATLNAVLNLEAVIELNTGKIKSPLRIAGDGAQIDLPLSTLLMGPPGPPASNVGPPGPPGPPGPDGATAPSTPVHLQVFSTPGSYTWTKPANAKWVMGFVIGGGQGGHAGGKTAANVHSSGGAGGGGGGLTRFSFPALLAGSTVSVTVGAGGAGGAPVTAANTPVGNMGTAGGASEFGPWACAGGGINSNGGYGEFYGANGLSGANFSDNCAAAGGGPGGSWLSNNTDTGGAVGGEAGRRVLPSGSTIAGGAGNTAFGGPGSNGDSPTSGQAQGGAGGGGGGAAQGGIDGGPGGNGGNQGGGGGGGGAIRNSATASGAGGNGGAGVVVVVTLF